MCRYGMVWYHTVLRVCVVVASLPTRNCTTQHRIQFDWLLVEEKTRSLGHYCNRSILHSFFIRHVTTQISYQAHIKQHDGRIATDCLCLIDRHELYETKRNETKQMEQSSFLCQRKNFCVWFLKGERSWLTMMWNMTQSHWYIQTFWSRCTSHCLWLYKLVRYVITLCLCFVFSALCLPTPIIHTTSIDSWMGFSLVCCFRVPQADFPQWGKEDLDIGTK